MTSHEGMLRKGDESMNKPAGAERVIELAEQVLAETASHKEIAELESLMADEPASTCVTRWFMASSR